jgi:hypothetical protein
MILKFILIVLIVGLFLYSKLLPYKDKLDLKYQRIFNFFNSIYQPILSFLKGLIKPLKVGNGISVDMAQVVLLVILIFILNIL